MVDPASDGAPVSLTFTWVPLPGDMGDILYTVNITGDGTLINSTTVESTNMTTVDNLPSCLNLMATLVATNNTDGNMSGGVCLEIITKENGEYTNRASPYIHVNVKVHTHMLFQSYF